MKKPLTTIAHIILVKRLTEDVSGAAKTIAAKANNLAVSLQKSGEDVSDQEVQAAMLGALIDADGNVDAVDVSDVVAIKDNIKEGRKYIAENEGALHMLHLTGDILGNAALVHIICIGLKSVGINMDEKKFISNVKKFQGYIKSVSGWPAKMMEQAFMWIAKKLGFSKFNQKIAGLSGLLITTTTFMAIAIYLFPSITTGIALFFSIGALVGKTAEIGKIFIEIIHHIDEHKKELANASNNTGEEPTPA